MIQACLGDAHLMHSGKSLGVRRKPRSQEAHRGREALNDGFSWVTGSRTFALLPVMGRMTVLEEISAVSLEASTHMPCGLGTDAFRKKTTRLFIGVAFHSAFLLISIQ